MRPGFLLIPLAVSVLCSCRQNAAPDIVPQPQSVTLRHSRCYLDGGAAFVYDGLDSASFAYAASFSELLERKLPASDASARKACEICFRSDSTIAEEAYILDISRKCVNIYASGLNGFVYAVQSLKQLLPTAIWGDGDACSADWSLKTMRIEDSPRFAYRGLHLDCARHFFSTDEIRRYIDLMEMHKLNTFHWHLTDDQGWRIEIKSHPEICSVGAWRRGTMVGRDFSSNDGQLYGGYYTQEELRSIVEYAAHRGITVIPEIDLPGHTQSILAAYPELGCTGGPYEVRCIWGVSDDVLCAGNDKALELLEDILLEVMDIFPSEYIHIGGDECPKLRWKNCPRCQARIRKLGLDRKGSGEFTPEDYLQSYVMNRLENFLNSHGRRIIGWDEVLDGEISQTATIMSWRGAAGGIKAARSGRDAIMTPNSYLYFDYCQSLDNASEPLCIGGYLPVSRVYSYEPYDELMSADECRHILGVQANMWTEYISDFSTVEYMLLPRLAALSEVQWCAAENKDFERFRDCMEHIRDIYDALGVNYARHLFDGRMDAEQQQLPSVEHKALGCEATLLSEPHLNYHFKAPQELLDGKRGSRIFTSGAWIGFEGTPLDIVLDLGEKEISELQLGILSDKGNYIFAPVRIELYSSQDGENFELLAEEDYEAEKADDPDGVKTFTLKLPQSVRPGKLRVVASTIDRLPDWHPGAGAKAFLFVDELMLF